MIIDDMAKVTGLDKKASGKEKQGVTMRFAKVTSVSPFTVQLAREQAQAVNCCSAVVGDVVLILIENGTMVAVAKRS